MSILKQLPSKARLEAARKLTAQIFEQTWNPNAVRRGAKFLRAPLIGPEIKNWYGDNDAMPTFKDFKAWFPELKLEDPREVYRRSMVVSRKKRNKGAPKKKTS